MNLQIKVLHVSVISFVILLCNAFPDGSEKIIVDVQEPSIKNVPYKAEGNISELSENDVPQGRISYFGSQLWKVSIDNEEKMAIFKDLKQNEHISHWGGNETCHDVLVKLQCIKEVSEKFEENNIKYTVVNENIQKAIDEENPPLNEDIDELQDRRGHRLTWIGYHRMADIDSYLDYLATSYPSICTLITIGRSIEGRPLRVLKISNGNRQNKAVWMDGGIHAREWISPATVTYIINHIVENYETESKSMRNINWYILPVVNPDGYEHTQVDRLWRKNRSKNGRCMGTDLNRNFGYHWGEQGSSSNGCHDIYAGSSPFSEPESAAIRNFITGTERGALWKAYISFHSYGQYILFPWGYAAMYTHDRNELQTVGNKMAMAMRAVSGAQYRVGSSAIMLYPASGGSDDWAKGVAGIKYAYTIELRDKGGYGFLLPSSMIIHSGKEGLAAVKVIADAVAASQ